MKWFMLCALDKTWVEYPSVGLPYTCGLKLKEIGVIDLKLALLT